MAEEIKCPKCGEANSKDTLACWKCNTSLSMSLTFDVPPPKGKQCPNCAASMSDNAVICLICGYNIRTGAVLRTMVQHPKERKPGARRSTQVPGCLVAICGVMAVGFIWTSNIR